MVSILGLWLPILVSAVFVFLLSFLLHMVLPLHKNDFKRLPDEAGVMDALRPFNLAPGDYMMPMPASPKDMNTPEHKAKVARGPVAMLTMYSAAQMNMGQSLGQWFAYCLLVGVCAAYVTGRATGPGAPYLTVHRFAGVTAFLGYSLALLQNSIWYKKNWGATLRTMFDGLLYAFVTGGTFGWLWPK
jgi:hypothetical protein